MNSKVTKRFIVLIQSVISENENKYVRLLEEHNICAKSISALSFNFCNLEKLQNCLNNVNNYGGLIFTSTRAVNAVSSALSSCTDLCVSKWEEKSNFSVGKATAALAKDLLKIKTLGSDSGNSKNLCQIIIENYGKDDKPLLFPCSSIRQDTIPLILSENRVPFEEITCYETVPNIEFESLWNKLVSKEGLPEIIVFFSPSGVQCAGYIVTSSYSGTINPKFVAIGPSTEKAFLEAKMSPYKVADKPTPDSVLLCIQEFLDS